MTHHRGLPLVLALTLLGSPAIAQSSRNVTLLARLNPGGGFSDLTAYAAPDGREYALLCGFAQTWVIECTDPRQPIRRSSIPGALSGWQDSPWRDVKTLGDHAYVISEGGAGLQVIDLSDPDNPTLVRTWGQSQWSHAHNMAIDSATATAYVSGTDSGTVVVDLTDPDNPALLATYTNGGYEHQWFVQHGYGYIADLRTNELLITDVSSPTAIKLLSATPTPGPSMAHSVWCDPDDMICVTANEAPGGPIGVFDVSDKRLPHRLAQISIPPLTAVPHDLRGRDGLLHVSHYTEGYQLIDLSDPAKPIQVGYYDTFGGASTGFNGAWGVDPSLPSGTVLVSDIVSGLWLFQATPVANRYGRSTSGGAPPEVHSVGSCWLGNNSFALELRDAPPSSRGLLMLGPSRDTRTVLGVELNVRLGSTTALLDVTTDASGKARLVLPIPDDTRLGGAKLYGQFVVADPTAPQGIAATRGMEFEAFAR